MNIHILPKIESRSRFEQMAAAYDMPAGTFAEACRADNKLRSERRGYVPSYLLRAWFSEHGRQHE